MPYLLNPGTRSPEILARQTLSHPRPAKTKSIKYLNDTTKRIDTNIGSTSNIRWTNKSKKVKYKTLVHRHHHGYPPKNDVC